MASRPDWTPDGDRADELVAAADRALEAGDRATAERLFREAVEAAPDEARARTRLGVLLAERGGTRRAGLRELRRASELAPDDPRVLATLGHALLVAGQRDEAEPCLRRSLELEPRASTCVFLGVCAEARRAFDEAVERYEQALELDPAYEEAHHDLACRLRFVEPPRAEHHLRRAIELDPGYALAHGELGHVLLAGDRVTEAVEALERSVELDGQRMWPSVRLAVALARHGALDAAVPHLERALRLRHSAPLTREHHECLRSSPAAAERAATWSRLYRAFLLGLKLELDDALGLLDDVDVRDRAHPLVEALRRALLADRAWWEGFDVHERGGEPLDALRAFEAATELEPPHVEAWIEVGKARYGLATRSGPGEPARRDELARARAALERALELAPEHAFAHLYLGLVFKHSGEPRRAEECMRRALELGDDGVFGAVLGDHLADVGRFHEAEAVFRRALEDHPECDMAWRDHGRTLVREHRRDRDDNWPRAVEAFERAVALRPGYAQNHFHLARALAFSGVEHLARARTHLERCLELRPTHPDAPELLADVVRLLRG